MITLRMCQVKYDASLRTVLSKFRFTLWGPAPHHSLKNRIFFWLPARWASGFSGDHQQDHQCLWLLLCYSFVLSFIVCILLGIKLLLLLLQFFLYQLVLACLVCSGHLLTDWWHCTRIIYNFPRSVILKKACNLNSRRPSSQDDTFKTQFVFQATYVSTLYSPRASPAYRDRLNQHWY